jgi:serine/threonine protein kinase
MLSPSMPDAPEATVEPASFGKYLLDEELARGGMARVFRARLQGPGGFEKKLVVKQILPELAQDPAFVALFVAEANTLVQMSHPNLVPVYELGVIDGVYFLAMEWVEGATVAELLRDGPLPEAAVAQIGAQIAEALRYAHERFQIVHRDVTPSNVIVDRAGHARLLDFGIAAPLEHTGKGELFGSPGYMAPEQLRGEPLAPQSDVFSLGSVLYEAISGRPACPPKRVLGVLELGPLPPAPLEVESSLRDLIARMLAADPSARPASAGEVADALRTWSAERHPRGVLPALAERAGRALQRMAAEPRVLSQPPKGTGSGRIEVRSIALSPALAELLSHQTERIERESPKPARAVPPQDDEPDPIGNDPELQRVARRFLRDIIVISLALIAALIYANYYEKRDEDQPPPTASEPRAAVPPPSAARSQPAQTAHPDQPAHIDQPAPQPDVLIPARAEQDTKQPGLLTVSASPWAEVRVDGHEFGVTPRRALPLRSGKHTLTLSCPPLDRTAKVSLDVHAGQELRVVADLNAQPPTIELR